MKKPSSKEEVIRILREGRERYFSSNANDGCCLRKVDYTCLYDPGVALKEELERYTEGSARDIGRKMQANVCLLALDDKLVTDDLNYALVWVEVGYPEDGIEPEFLDSLFEGFDSIARPFLAED